MYLACDIHNLLFQSVIRYNNEVYVEKLSFGIRFQILFVIRLFLTNGALVSCFGVDPTRHFTNHFTLLSLAISQ